MTQDQAEILAERVPQEDARVRASAEHMRGGRYHVRLELKRKRGGGLVHTVSKADQWEEIRDMWGMLA